ncbi:hypothetical protein CVT24_005948 [Panaeolus cyanescens]|uniref:Uncharacterized protein n=1 Tax=Panaeolus cyanescens TaxID=181874 RepID=A0A409V8Z6_9AGAR|nr:hypothetical protein CVT24_005948 [Panaeolus cyanescens]
MKSFFSRRSDRDSQAPSHKPSSRDTYKFWSTKPELPTKQATYNGDVAAAQSVRGHEPKSSRSAAKVPLKQPHDSTPSAHISDRTKDKTSSTNTRVSSSAYPVYYPQPIPGQPPPKPPPSRTAELAHSDRHQQPVRNAVAPSHHPFPAQESRDTTQKVSRHNHHRPDPVPVNQNEIWHPPPYASSSRAPETFPRDQPAQQPHRSNEDKDRIHDAARRDRYRERERARDSDQETVRPREDYQRTRDGDRVRDKARRQEKQREAELAEFERQKELERDERLKEMKRLQEQELLKEQEKRQRQQRRELREAEKERRRQKEKEAEERELKLKERPRVLSKTRHESRHTDIPSDDNRHIPKDPRRPSVENRGTDSETERKRPAPSVIIPVDAEVAKPRPSKDQEKRKESTGWISDSYAVRKSSKQVNKDPQLSDEGGNFSDSSLKRRFKFPRLLQKRHSPEEKKVKASRVSETMELKPQAVNELVSDDTGMPIYLPPREHRPVESPTRLPDSAAESGNETDKTRNASNQHKRPKPSHGDEILVKPPDPRTHPFENPRRLEDVVVDHPQARQNIPAPEEPPHPRRSDRTPRMAPIPIDPLERTASMRPQGERALEDIRSGPVFPLSPPPDMEEEDLEAIRTRGRFHEPPADIFAQIRMGTTYHNSQPHVLPSVAHPTPKPEPPPSIRPRVKELPPNGAPYPPTDRLASVDLPESSKRMSIVQPHKIELKHSSSYQPQVAIHPEVGSALVPPAAESIAVPNPRRTTAEPPEQSLPNGMPITRPSTAMGYKDNRTHSRSGAHHHPSHSADMQRRGPSAATGSQSRVASTYGHYNLPPPDPVTHGDVMTRLQEARLQQKLGMSIARPSTTTGHKSSRHYMDNQHKHLSTATPIVNNLVLQSDAGPQATTRTESHRDSVNVHAKSLHHPPPTPRITSVLPPQPDAITRQPTSRAEASGAPAQPESQPSRAHHQPPPTPRVGTVMPPPVDYSSRPVRMDAPAPVLQGSRSSHQPPPTPRVGTLPPLSQTDPTTLRSSSTRVDVPTVSNTTQGRPSRTVPPTPRIDNRRLDPQPLPSHQEQRTYHHRREASNPEDQLKGPVDLPISASLHASDMQQQTRKTADMEQPPFDKPKRLHTLPSSSHEAGPTIVNEPQNTTSVVPSSVRHAVPEAAPPIDVQPSRQLYDPRKDGTVVTSNKETHVGTMAMQFNDLIVSGNEAPTSAFANPVNPPPRVEHHKASESAQPTSVPVREDATVIQRDFPPPIRIHRIIEGPPKEPETVVGSTVPAGPLAESRRIEPLKDSKHDHREQGRPKDGARESRKQERQRDNGTERPSPRQGPSTSTTDSIPPPLVTSESITPRNAPTAQPLEVKDLNQPTIMNSRSDKNDSKPSPTVVQPQVKVEAMPEEVEEFKMPFLAQAPIVPALPSRPHDMLQSTTAPRPPVVPSTPLHIPRELSQPIRGPTVPSTPLHVPREMPQLTRGQTVPSTPLHVSRDMPAGVKAPPIPSTPLQIHPELPSIPIPPNVPRTPLHLPRDMSSGTYIPYNGKDGRGKAPLQSMQPERFNVAVGVFENVIKPMGVDIPNTNPSSFWASTPRADQASQARLSTIPGPPTPRGSVRQSLQSVINFGEAMAERRQSAMVWQPPIAENTEPTQVVGDMKRLGSEKTPLVNSKRDPPQEIKEFAQPKSLMHSTSTRGESLSRHLPLQTPRQLLADLPRQPEVLSDNKVAGPPTLPDGLERKKEARNSATFLDYATKPWEIGSSVVAPAPLDSQHSNQYQSIDHQEVRARKNSNSPRRGTAAIPSSNHRTDSRRTHDNDRHAHTNQTTTRAEYTHTHPDSDRETSRRPWKAESGTNGPNVEKRTETGESPGAGSVNTRIQHPVLAELLSAPKSRTVATHLSEQPTPAQSNRVLVSADVQKHSPKLRTSPSERHRQIPEGSARTSPQKRALEVPEKHSREFNRDPPTSRDVAQKQHHDSPSGPISAPPASNHVPMTPMLHATTLGSEYPSRAGTSSRYPVEQTSSRDKRQSVLNVQHTTQSNRVDNPDIGHGRNLVIHPSNLPVEPALRTAPLHRPVYPASNARHRQSSSLPVNSLHAIVQETQVIERPIQPVVPMAVQPTASMQKDNPTRNSVYENNPPTMRREPSEETILLRTPSSLAHSVALKPTFSRQSMTPSTASQKAKKGIFDIFKRNSGQASNKTTAEASPYEIWHPNSAETPDSSPGQEKPVPRTTIASTPHMAPIPVSIPITVAPEHKSVTAKVFTPFRYLTMGSKKHHTLSDVSLEAQDGTPANTEIGSPNMSILSQIPIQLPPVQDAMVAAKDWVVKEADKQVHAKNRLGRYKPGIVFDAKEDPPEDQKKTSRMGRPNPSSRHRSSRKETEKSSPPHESRTVTINNDYYEPRGDSHHHHREHLNHS